MSYLEEISTSILAKLPLGTPPPGVSPNFFDPPNAGTSYIIYGEFMLPIMLGFFAIRIYSRFRIIRQPALDDRKELPPDHIKCMILLTPMKVTCFISTVRAHG